MQESTSRGARVAVVESTDSRKRYDTSTLDALDVTPSWWLSLQRPVGAILIVVVDVRLEDTPQVLFPRGQAA